MRCPRLVDAMNGKQFVLSRLAPAGLGALALGALMYVGRASLPEESAPLRVPADAAASSGSGKAMAPLDRTKLESLADLDEELPGSWPGFRGALRDGVSDDGTMLDDVWSEGDPARLWSVDVGEGYAGAAIEKGRVYLMDYDQGARMDVMRCLSLASGKELWRLSYPLDVKRNHGMSRTVPAVADGRVVAIGPKCHVACLDAQSGEFQWGIDLVTEFGSKVPPWYAGQCPLIDDGRVILAPAGDELLMMAVDLQSGEMVWTTPNPMGWKMTHVSIVPVTLCGRKTYVYCGHRGVAGVAADSGEILWQSDAWRISLATVCSPVGLPDDRLFFSGGYNAGSLLMEVREEGGKWMSEEIERFDADHFGATQQTPVLFENYLYGVRPNGELVCLDDQGGIQWTSGPEHRFGLGPFMIADGYILAMNDEGTLSLIEAAPDRFELVEEASILEGHDSWGPMAIAGGRLIARDLTKMVCVDLEAE